MLGLLLIYFIWKSYSELAFEYHRSRWGYALLGIGTYYAGTFIGGIVIYLVGVVLGKDFAGDDNSLVVNLLAFPFGLLAVWGLYKIIQKRWSSGVVSAVNDSLDAGLISGPNNNQD